MDDFWDALFASFPPSPEWAPFWSSLFEGALSASLIWLVAQIGPIRTSAFQLICYSLIQVCRFVFAIISGFQDGWPRLSGTECFGRTIVVSSFIVAIYTAYYEQVQSCTLSGFIESSLLAHYREGAQGWQKWEILMAMKSQSISWIDKVEMDTHMGPSMVNQQIIECFRTREDRGLEDAP